jgi:hypothetical protein
MGGIFMSKGYAYLDHTESGVLHIVDDEATARQNTGPDGKVEEVWFPHEKGYPVVQGHQYVIYADGTEKQGRAVPGYLQQLVNALK